MGQIRKILFFLPQFLLLALLPASLSPSQAESSLPPAVVKIDFATIEPQEDKGLIEEFGYNEIERLGSPEKAFDTNQILSDYKKRISEPFAVPEELMPRVRFWFDVYTRYDEQRRIIHHTKYPWIIFKVVDTSPIVFADKPSRRWQRNILADKLTASELKRMQTQLKKIARGKKLSELDADGKLAWSELKKLPGSMRKNAAEAAKNIRVQTGQKNFYMAGLQISGRYLPSIEKAFKSEGLPWELTRIPFVESSFNKAVTSKVGASGIWQFMDHVGKKFMIVEPNIDERRSPIKSSLAAARLLKENYQILNRSWPLAVTAYNHGPGGIRKASQRARSIELAKIIKTPQSKAFGFASSNFYCEFLAALHAQVYRDMIFDTVTEDAALASDLLKLPRAIRVGTLTQKLGISKDEFLILNPDLKGALKRNSLLPKGFRVHLEDKWHLAFERTLANSKPLARKRNI